ncbi:MAG TPA: response regulator [Desulfotomaculum sp.]|nr:response regulator [Desulfotomaculum sp.]
MSVTVLIVEDDPAMRLFLKNTLEEIDDIKVIGEAGNALQAVEIFQATKPRIVFIDINLPGKTGVALAREIFSISPWTYLIFATAYTEYQRFICNAFSDAILQVLDTDLHNIDITGRHEYAWQI